MRKLLSFIAAVVLLATVFAFTATAYADYTVYSHCGNGKPLNVREGPGKDYWILRKIPYGEAISIYGETSPGWLQLSSGGFVQASLTSKYYPGPYVPTPKPAPNPNKNKTDLDSVYATAKNVDPYIITLKATQRSNGLANVRWAPSKTSKLLKAYPAGTEMKVIAELKNWYQVEDPINGSVGYVNTAYVVK